MELTSIYQRNDPRAQGFVSETYKNAAASAGGGTSNPLHSNGESVSSHNTQYLKRGPYTPPAQPEEITANHDSAVICITSFHPSFDSRGLPFEPPLIVTGCMDGSITAWHMLNLEKLYTMKGHSDSVTDIKMYQPAGELLIVVVSASKDKTVRMTQLQSGRSLGVLNHSDAVWSIDLLLQHNVEPIIVSGCLDGTVCLWSMLEQKLMRCIDCGSGAILKTSIFCSDAILQGLQEGSMTFNDAHNDIHILVASEMRTLSLWNMQTGLRERQFKAHPMRITDCVALIPNKWRFKNEEFDISQDFRADLNDRAAKFGRSKRLKAERWAEYSDDLEDDMLLIYNQALVISACMDGRIRIFSVTSGFLLRVLEDPGAISTSVRPPVLSLCIYWPTKDSEMFRPRTFTKLQRDDDEITDKLKKTADFFKSAAKFGADADSEIDHEETLCQFITAATEPRILGAFKDGNVLSWDIMTGTPFRQYRIFTGEEEPSISCLLTDALTEREDKFARTHEAGGQNKEMLDKDGVNPIIFAGGFSGRLRRRHVRHRSDEVTRAYEMDLRFRVSRQLEHDIPIEFLDYPRVYMLGKAFNGLNYLFAGPNFKLLVRATLEGNVGFVNTFLPYAKGGMVMAARARFLTARQASLPSLEQRWLEEYRHQEAEDRGRIYYTIVMLQQYLTIPFDIARLVLDAFKETLEGPEVNDHDSLLRAAMSKNNTGLVRTVLETWVSLVNRAPKDLLDQTVGPYMLLNTAELVEVSMAFPELFEHFICSLRPVKSHELIQTRCDTTIRANKEIILKGGGAHLTEEIDMWSQTNDKQKRKTIDSHVLHENLRKVFLEEESEVKRGQDVECFYLPINNCCSEPLLNAILRVSEVNHSPAIFDSPVGETLARYLWHAGGREWHIKSMLVFLYDVLVVVATVVLFTPPINYESSWEKTFPIRNDLYEALYVLTFLNISRLVSLGEILKADQETVRSFFRKFWTWIFIINKTLQITANCILLRYISPPNRSHYLHNYESMVTLRVYLAITVVSQFFRMLYFARPLESTGVLISLIFEIVAQIGTYISFMAFLILIAGQIMYVLASESDETVIKDNPFGTFAGALLELLSWVFAGYDPSSYSSFQLGTLRTNLALVVGNVYYFMAGIIMFNILIAFMTDIFERVYQQGKANWRAMQVSTVAQGLYFRTRGYHIRKERRLMQPLIVHYLTRATQSGAAASEKDSEKEDNKDSLRRLRAHLRYFSNLQTKFGTRLKRNVKKLDEMM